MPTTLPAEKPAMVEAVASEAGAEALQTVETSGVTEIPAEAVAPIVADMAEAAVEAGIQAAEAAAEAAETAEVLEAGAPDTEQSLLPAMTEAAQNVAEEAYVGTNEETRAVLSQVAEGVARVAEERVSWEVAVSEARGRQYSLRQTRGMPWEKQINRAYDQSINRYATLTVTDVMPILDEIGEENLPVGMNLGTFNKVTRKKRGSRSAHELSKNTMRMLPTALQDPVAWFENAEQNCIYIITDLIDDNGAPVVAIVRKNQIDNEGARMHQIVSMYGMSNVLKYMYDHLPEGSRYSVHKKEAFSAMAVAPFTDTAVDYQALEKRFTEIVPQGNTDVKKFSERRQTETDAFKRWFGDSVVVNEDGSPKVMYHGTRAENGVFWVFDYSKAIKKGGHGLKALGEGIYFTEKKLDGTERYGSRVIPVYLRIESPFIPRVMGVSLREAVATQLQIDADDVSHNIQDTLKQHGYDGVISGEVAVVFSPTQIKSATDNVGTFDPENPDIRYSERRPTAPSLRETLLAMEETPDMTATEKELLAKYKKLVADYRELENQAEAQRTLAEAAEREYETLKTTPARDEYLAQNNRLGVLQSKLRRASDALYHAEKRTGFADLMNRYRMMVQAFNAGSTRTQAAERLQARLEEVTRMLKDAQQTGDIMDEEALEEELTFSRIIMDKRFHS